MGVQRKKTGRSSEFADSASNGGAGGGALDLIEKRDITSPWTQPEVFSGLDGNSDRNYRMTIQGNTAGAVGTVSLGVNGLSAGINFVGREIDLVAGSFAAVTLISGRLRIANITVSGGRFNIVVEILALPDHNSDFKMIRVWSITSDASINNSHHIIAEIRVAANITSLEVQPSGAFASDGTIQLYKYSTSEATTGLNSKAILAWGGDNSVDVALKRWGHATDGGVAVGSLDAQIEVPYAGTLKNLRIHGDVNLAATTPCTVFVNGAATSIVATVPIGGSDASDTTNTHTVAAGDRVEVRTSLGTRTLNAELEIDSTGAQETAPSADTRNVASAGTTSTSFVVVGGMTITPGAGTWLVWFTGALTASLGETPSVQIFANAVAQGDAQDGEISAGAPGTTFCRIAKVTVADGQAIDGRLKGSGGDTVTLNNGVLAISKVTSL